MARFIIRFGLSISMLSLTPILGGATVPSSVYDLPEIKPVQSRAYYSTHGLTLQAGLIPSDPFNKSITFGGAYTIGLSRFFYLEMVNFNLTSNMETNLKRDLLTQFPAQVTNKGLGGVLDYPIYLASMNLVFTPFYNKSLFFNKNIVHGEISFAAGGGAMHFSTEGIKPMVSFGVILSFFSDSGNSWKFDFRDHIYIDAINGPVGLLALSVGYAFHFGSYPEEE